MSASSGGSKKVKDAIKLAKKRGHRDMTMAEDETDLLAAKKAPRPKRAKDICSPEPASVTPIAKKKTGKAKKDTKQAKKDARKDSKQAKAAAAGAGKKKTGDPSYKRADKSLGLLCERFVSRYEHMKGIEVTVEDAANQLGVERRRIYDIINILEAVRVVSRVKKNTYTWNGPEILPIVFAELQQEALSVFRDRAIDNGIIDESHPKGKVTKLALVDANGGNKSMASLTLDFMKLFLAGDSIITVVDTSQDILGTDSSLFCEGGNYTEEQKKEARAQKSKIRRLYDIANVLAAINVIRKENIGSSFASNNTEQPQFRWIYPMQPKEFMGIYAENVKAGVDINHWLPKITAIGSPSPVGKKARLKTPAKAKLAKQKMQAV